MRTTNINEVELNILSLLMQKKHLRQYIFDHCEESFIVDPLNRLIFGKAHSLYLKEEDFDNVVLYENLKRADVNERLSEILLDTIPIGALANSYCKILFQNHLQKLIKEASSSEEFDRIAELKARYSFDDVKIKHISEGITNFRESYQSRANKAVVTCFDKLDRHLGSFMGGDYIALGGSTGAGKTTIALNFAKQFCMQGKNVLFFSLEMPIEQLTNRFCCMLKYLNAKKFRDFGFTEEEIALYERGLEEMKDWNLNVVCDYSLTTEKMETYIRQHENVDLVFLDYLGLMSGHGNKSLYEKSTIISRQLKCLASKFDVPILILVQLSRNFTQRQDKRPILSDIRESGAIEQDADFVIFAHREGLFDPSVPITNLELIIAKNRHGDNNFIVPFHFDLATQNIREI